jgi:hypothetical protein
MMADRDLPSKLELEELALTAGRAYNFACGFGPMSDDDWSNVQPGWEAAAAWAIRRYEQSESNRGDREEDAESVPVSWLVKPVHDAVMAGMEMHEDYASLDAVSKLQWEAATRHLFGAITCDPGEDSDAAELSWVQWVADRYHASAGGQL